MSKFTYLMGLVATDGYLVKFNGTPKYTEIESTEEELLTKISNEYNIKLHYRERVIKDKLRYYWKLKLKDVIPHEYISMFDKYRTNLLPYYLTLKEEDKFDFILGMWDGDGSICKTKANEIRITYVVNSETASIMEILDNFFKSQSMDYCKYFDKRGVGCYNLQVYAKDKRKFLNCIYNNKDLYCIQRKKDMAFELLNSDYGIKKGEHK